MKIWVIGRSYPTPQNKMRGSFELEQAKMLAKHGHDVTYLAVILHPVNKVKKWGYVHFEDGAVQVYIDSIFWAPERMHIHPKLLLAKTWSTLFSKAEKGKGMPDVIHIHYPGMNGSPAVVAEYKQRGAKIVTTEHWTKVLTDSMDAYQRKQLIEFSGIADEILCVGEPLKRAIESITHTKKEIKIVPNIVSDLFQPSADKGRATEYHFIAVGRLAPIKQMDLLAETFAKTFRDEPNVFLDIVGGGSERKKIERIIQQYHMPEQIRLTGTLSREETAKKVSQSDCLICFSRLETFGVPVIEAWACGIPVIASDALGFREYWEDDLGCIVPSGNTNELSKAMKQIQERRFDPAYIHNFAHKYFSEETVYNLLMESYFASRPEPVAKQSVTTV